MLAFTTGTLEPLIVASGIAGAEAVDTPTGRTSRFSIGWTGGKFVDDCGVFLTGDTLKVQPAKASAAVFGMPADPGRPFCLCSRVHHHVI